MHYEIFYYGKRVEPVMMALPVLDEAGVPFTYCAVAADMSAKSAYAAALGKLIATLPNFSAVQEVSAVVPRSWRAMGLLDGRVTADEFSAGYRIYIGIACRVD